MAMLEQEDKLTLREKLSYMTSRAVQMPLGITLILVAFQVSYIVYDLKIFLSPNSEWSSFWLNGFYFCHFRYFQ